MLVRESVKDKLAQVEPGDEVEVIWNDAVMIEASSSDALFFDSPVLMEKARAVMKHRGVVVKIVELEADHAVILLFVRKGSNFMLPRGNGERFTKLRRHALLVIPTALISDIRIIKKGAKNVSGLMSIVKIERVEKYRVKSILPRVVLRK
ncbi:MAG: hypothetical protein QW692_00645 [Nitrososphaerota archaeon]